MGSATRRAGGAWASLGCRDEQALAPPGGDQADLRQGFALLGKLGVATRTEAAAPALACEARPSGTARQK